MSTTHGHGEALTERARTVPYGICGVEHPLLSEIYCERLPGHPGRHRACIDSGSADLNVTWPASPEPADHFMRPDHRTLDLNGRKVQFRVEKREQLEGELGLTEWVLIGTDGHRTAPLERLGTGAEPARRLEEFTAEDLADYWRRGAM